MTAILLVLAAPTAITLLATIIGCITHRDNLQQYVLNQLISLDQRINTICGGDPDETISAAAYRKGSSLSNPPRWRRTYRFINMIFFLQDDHCLSAYESEVTRRHLHPSYGGQ